MAENSLRERIILADLTLIQSLSSISTVVRTIQSYSDLQSYAVTQFPVVAIVGRLPVPTYKPSLRIREDIDQVLSILRVDFYTYFMNNENSDTELSSLLDDMWVKLHSDPTRSRICLGTTLEMTEDTQVFAPYGAFRITAIHQYKHTIEGI